MIYNLTTSPFFKKISELYKYYQEFSILMLPVHINNLYLVIPKNDLKNNIKK